MQQCERCGNMAHVLHECILCGKKVCPSCYRNAVGTCRGCMP